MKFCIEHLCIHVSWKLRQHCTKIVNWGLFPPPKICKYLLFDFDEILYETPLLNAIIIVTPQLSAVPIMINQCFLESSIWRAGIKSTFFRGSTLRIYNFDQFEHSLIQKLYKYFFICTHSLHILQLLALRVVLPQHPITHWLSSLGASQVIITGDYQSSVGLM